MGGTILVIFGCILITVSFFVPPTGVIDPTVLTAFGEILTSAGTVIGIDFHHRSSATVLRGFASKPTHYFVILPFISGTSNVPPRNSHYIMRTINSIIVHCSATPEGKNFTVEDIDRWHRQRGWRCIGYQWVICLDGSIHKGRDESEKGSNCVSYLIYAK